MVNPYGRLNHVQTDKIKDWAPAVPFWDAAGLGQVGVTLRQAQGERPLGGRPSRALTLSSSKGERQELVRTVGLEPTRPSGQKILSLQRLPVPPRPHVLSDRA